MRLTYRRMVKYVALAAVVMAIAVPAAATPDLRPPGQPCKLSAAGGVFNGQTGVMVDGHCVSVDGSYGGGAGPQPEYRMVGCLADGKAVYDGDVLTDSRCAPKVPRCRLLVEGGQSGPNVIWAYEYQTREPGKAWTPEAFWCPTAQTATPVPDAVTIRDRVIKLLPRVAIRSTGSPATLVNVQTILWADTPTARTLGRIQVVGQPVWLRLRFAHADWDFGDDTTDSSGVPGKVYDPDGDPCAQVMCPDYYGHVYTSTGLMQITLTVSWRASYSLDGTHFSPVDPAALTGPASSHRIRARQARTVLVPDPDNN